MGRIPKLRKRKTGLYTARYTDPATGAKRDLYFGRDKAGAEIAYNAFVAELCQTRNTPQAIRPKISASVEELVLGYLRATHDRYEPASFGDYRKAGELLTETCGNLPVAAFLIPQFRKLIDRMIGKGWALRTINVRIGVVKAIFRHAMEGDLISGEQYFRIKGVARVRSDDIRVKPAREVPPVPVDVVDRTLPFFTPMVADIVRVQLRAGMRAGEVCRMRFGELAWDADGILWYRPVKHKTARHGVNPPRGKPISPPGEPPPPNYRGFIGSCPPDVSRL